MSKKLKGLDFYSTYEFHDVGSKKDYHAISRKDGSFCGWIGKNCINPEKAIIKK